MKLRIHIPANFAKALDAEELDLQRDFHISGIEKLVDGSASAVLANRVGDEGWIFEPNDGFFRLWRAEFDIERDLWTPQEELPHYLFVFDQRFSSTLPAFVYQGKDF